MSPERLRRTGSRRFAIVLMALAAGAAIGATGSGERPVSTTRDGGAGPARGGSGTDDEKATQRTGRKRIHLGSRVRTGSRTTLLAALRHPSERKPEPGQLVRAGRETSVTGYQRGPGNRPLYALRDAPGLWAEEWLDPL